MGTNTIAILQKYALPFFILLAILLRFGTFFPSVINHDESTYILIGDGLLHGQTYLVDSFDTKPVGIFLAYALLSFLGGGSIFMFRLFTAAVIGLTAYLIYRLGKKTSGDFNVGLASGLVYILLTSIFKYYGLSPNTELFFVPFAVGAISLVWDNDRHARHYLLAGLLLGIGFIIKYVIAADALALGLIILWKAWKDNHLLKAIFQHCILLVLGFLIPIGLVYFYYSVIGQIDNFLFYTFEVTSKYPVEASWDKRLLFVLDFFGRFFPFTLLAIFAWRKRNTQQDHWWPFLFLWMACVTIMTLLPGKIFGHYQIQMMPILALMAGQWFTEVGARFNAKHRVATVVIFAAISVGLAGYYISKPDYPKQIAGILEEKLNEGDKVYTGNYHHIINHLLGQPSPTPYIHSSLLFYEHHVNALSIDLEETAKEIVDGIQPRFILLRHEHPKNQLTDYIYQHYHKTEDLPDDVWLLERK